MYFVYQYYLYLVGANPVMEEYFQQQLEQRRELTSKGPNEQVLFPNHLPANPMQMGPPRAVMQRGRGRSGNTSRSAPSDRGRYSARIDRNPRPL